MSPDRLSVPYSLEQQALSWGQALSELYQRGYSFALYRLPQQEPVLILSQNSVAKLQRLADLQSYQGFLFAPFALTKDMPALMIVPELSARSASQISALLSSLSSQTAVNSVPQTASNSSGDGTARLEPRLDQHEQHEQSAFSAYASELPVAIRERWGELAGDSSAYTRYCQAFAAFMQELSSGGCGKLVLSRQQSVSLPAHFAALQAWARACSLYPNMMVSLVATKEGGMWLGSSPEILLSGSGAAFRTVALAGTMPLPSASGPVQQSNSVTALPQLSDWSSKNRTEQQIVVDYIASLLQQHASCYSVVGPFTARAGKVVHLKSEFAFKLKTPSDLAAMVEALHPTPAVCGLPKERAFAFIQEHEGYNRSYYAGIVGPFNCQEHTALYVNLRCLRLEDPRCSLLPLPATAEDKPVRHATLFAGGGILSSSEVQDEFKETCAKMATLYELWRNS